MEAFMFGDPSDHVEPGDETVFEPAYPLSQAEHEPDAQGAPAQAGGYSAAFPATPLARFNRLLQTEPAYRVLLIAVVVVLISSVVFMMGIGSLLIRPGGPSQDPTPGTGVQVKTPQHTATSVATATMQPTATPTPTPTATPTQQPTPTQAAATPTQQPTTTQTTPTPPAGPTVTITHVPQTVNNLAFVTVTVQTSVPQVPVTLTVTYEDGSTNGAGPVETGGDGQASLTWNVIAPLGAQTQKATLVATFQYNGQRISSAPITVTVKT